MRIKNPFNVAERKVRVLNPSDSRDRLEPVVTTEGIVLLEETTDFLRTELPVGNRSIDLKTIVGLAAHVERARADQQRRVNVARVDIALDAGALVRAALDRRRLVPRGVDRCVAVAA